MPLGLLALPAVLSLGACALPDFDSFRAPTAESVFRPLSVTNVKDRVLGQVPPEDLVDAGGRCANAGAPPPPAGGDQPGAAAPAPAPEPGLLPSAVALDMSECDVVKRAGVPERVEIGANTCIDRGALDDTVLEDGVKLDNLIQIGHNVRIGAHTAMAGCVGVAGSARIGAHCTVGGGAIVLGHLTLADGVHVSVASVVTVADFAM